MTAPPTPAHRMNPDTVAEQFELPPVALAWPCRDDGPSAAAFAGRALPERVVGSPPDAQTHVLTVISAHFETHLSIDGRTTHRGAIAPGALQFLRAGQTPHAVMRGDWSLLHLYLPARDLQLLAEDMGHAATAAAALEFTDPCFTRDALLSRLGLRLERRLRRGDKPSRLELDELALRIGERLLRRYALAKPPKAKRRPALSAREQALVRELLGDAPQPGLAELAALLDRSELEALAAFERAFRAAPGDVREALLKGRGS